MESNNYCATQSLGASSSPNLQLGQANAFYQPYFPYQNLCPNCARCACCGRMYQKTPQGLNPSNITYALGNSVSGSPVANMGVTSGTTSAGTQTVNSFGSMIEDFINGKG